MQCIRKLGLLVDEWQGDCMEEMVLNNELTLAYPDGFHELNEMESYQVFGMDTPDRWSIRDEARHAIISIQSNESHPSNLRKLVSTQELAQRAEKATSKAYKDAGYSCTPITTRELCGQESCGFEFEYAIDGTPQVGRIDVFTHPIERGNCCYTIYLHSSKENADENKALYEAMLASMALE